MFSVKKAGRLPTKEQSESKFAALFDRRVSHSQQCTLIIEEQQKRKLQRVQRLAAWSFIEETLIRPLDDLDSLPPLLDAHKNAYGALTPPQKHHLSATLIPLLIAKKDEIVAGVDEQERKGRMHAGAWFHALIALSHVDFGRRSHGNDCMISTHNQRNPKNNRPEMRMCIIVQSPMPTRVL